MNRANNQLTEGVDYYIENGLWVFTGAYHLKRGYCCGSGCRHCPYSCQLLADQGQSATQPLGVAKRNVPVQPTSQT